MANNSEQESYANSLKASFCRHLFPDLMQFLSAFDISERGGRVNNDTLNMHFLLQAYSHLKNVEDDKIRALEGYCKWTLGSSVKEQDVLLAIDEYFEITSTKHDLKTLRDELLKNAIIPGRSEKWKLEDNTTFAILKHFGIVSDQDKNLMGDQRKAFSNFIRDSYKLKTNQNQQEVFFDIENAKKYKELGFANAFHLLRSLRNWGAHALEEFNSDEITRYYRFILFTHIGIIYICRRIWNKNEENLLLLEKDKSKKYKKPDPLQLKKEKVVVNIVANTTSHTISNCEYQIGKGNFEKKEGLEGNKVSFEFEIPKYTFFTIRFDCKESSYEISRKMTYYVWNPTLTITIEPPAKIHCSCEVIGGGDFNDVEDKICSLLSKHWDLSEIKISNEEIQNDCKEIQKTLANIEPSILLLQSHVTKENINLKKDIIDVLETSEKTISERYDNLYQLIVNNQDQTTQNFDKINRQIGEVNNKIKEKELAGLKKEKALLSWLIPGIFTIIAAILGLWLFCKLDICNVDYSVFYVKNQWLPYVVILLLLLLGSIVFYLYTTTKYVLLSSKKNKAKGILPFCAIFAILVTAWTCVPNKSIEDLIDNYNFAANNHREGDNAEAAKLMENYLNKEKPIDDEQVRIQLANYYLNYANKKERALEVTRPMRDDVEKYRRGSLYAAEALYEEGKDYRRVNLIIDKYNRLYKEKPALINRIQGIMYCYGQYYDKNVQKGVELLKEAADVQGDKIAQYYLGHVYSHVMSEWKTSVESTDTLFNLFNAIDYYRKAVPSVPKAALELGVLFADLNMTDSAKYYYEKAIVNSDDSLNMEANYRMGILLYNLGDINNKPLSDAVDLNYDPALLFAAVNEQQHQGAIECYESMGRYKGHRYIPPVVFEYLVKGEKRKALDTLNSTRPYGMFNDEFVDAMYAMIISKDSIAAAELLDISADKGCKYAKMIRIFRKMENEESNGDYTLSNIGLLEELGNEISFANILASQLLSNKAYYLDSVAGNVESYPIYRRAAENSLKAINQGHPAGAVLFSSGYLSSYYFDHMIERSLPILMAKHELSIAFLMLRMAPFEEKKQFIMEAYTHSYRIYQTGKKKYRNDGSEYIEMVLPEKLILDQLISTNNADKLYTEKLFSAGMQLIGQESDSIFKNILSSRIHGMSEDGFGPYIDSLMRVYRDDSFKIDILKGKYSYLKEGENISIPFEWTAKRHHLDNLTILNEFCEIDNHIYNKPL